MPLTDLSNPDVLLRENWEARRRVGPDGTPTLPPSFVAEVGPRVWIIDVRADGELIGPQGHIPGVWRVPMESVGDVSRLLAGHTPVVLVCEDGARSRTAARYLAELGMTTVAAMEGGMVHWRAEGYSVSREPAALGRRLQAPAPGHGSDGRLLQLPRHGAERRLTRAAIVEHVGDPAKVRRIKLAALLVGNQTSCVDGREDRAIVGTPGGDAGEFLLGLAAAERVMGTEIALDVVPALTRVFADTFGGIYLHTDNHALNRLVRSFRSDGRIEPSVAGLRTVDDWEGFLRRPPATLHRALLEHLVQPDHVGCGHLKLALIDPVTYGVRPPLITRFFEAFFEGLWTGARDLHWAILGGDHAEGAVVNVTMEGTLWPFSEVPMVAPSIGGVQMFVNHPQVVAYLREQNARFLHGRARGFLPELRDPEALVAEIPRLGAAQTGATLAALAGGLPVFDVHFGGGEGVDVIERDPVPSA